MAHDSLSFTFTAQLALNVISEFGGYCFFLFVIFNTVASIFNRLNLEATLISQLYIAEQQQPSEKALKNIQDFSKQEREIKVKPIVVTAWSLLFEMRPLRICFNRHRNS